MDTWGWLVLANDRDVCERIAATRQRGPISSDYVLDETLTRLFAATRCFTGLTSFVVMQELGMQHVLTGDAHFEQVGMGFMRLP